MGGADTAAAAKPQDELDGRVLGGSAWVAVGYGLKAALSMGSMVALVRLIEPKAFGLLALAFICILLVEHVQSGGVHAALICARDDLERAASSAFVYAVFSSCIGYGVVYALAPLAERLLHAHGLTSVVRVLAFTLVIRALATVPAAILERSLNFRSRTKAEVAGAIVQTATTLTLAVSGFGVWSLVIGQIAGTGVESSGMWLLAKWWPSLRHVSWPVLRRMLAFGRFVGAGNIIGLVNETMDNLIVGRLLGTTLLGFYSVTFRLADFPTSVIGYIVGRVMLPAYSSVQGDLERFRRAFLQNVQRVALFSLPVAVVLAVAAHDIVLGLLGERWLPVATPLRVLAGYSIVRSFASCAGPAFQALGRPALVPLLALPQTIVTVPLLFVLVPRLGVKGAALAMFAGFAASAGFALFRVSRLLALAAGDFARTLLPLVTCAVMVGAALLLEIALRPAMPAVLALALSLATAAVVYVAGIATVGRESIAPILAVIRMPRTPPQAPRPEGALS